MKKTAIWVLRHLLIPVAFVWSTGIIEGIKNIDTSSKNTSPYSSFDSVELSTLEIKPDNFLSYKDSIITERKKEISETGIYEPYFYFRDLKQFEMFKFRYFDSLNKIPEKRFLLSNLSYNDIVNLRDENWRNNEMIARSYEANLSKTKTPMSINDARAYWFPKEVAHEKEVKDNFSWQEFWQAIWNWMLSFYFKGMFISSILFLLWRIKFKEDLENVTSRYTGVNTMQKFAPLSFIYSLLIWPIILVRDIKNRGKEVLAKADVLSRRREMLDLFSKEEKALIEIGRKMSVKEFRHFLSERGLVRRHSLLLALVFVPLIFIKSYGAPSTTISKEKILVKTEIVNQSQSFNYDVGWQVHMDKECLVESLELSVINISILISFFIQRFETLKGFKRSIDGVPRVSELFAKQINKKIHKLKKL